VQNFVAIDAVDMNVLIFGVFCLKMRIHAQKNVFLAD